MSGETTSGGAVRLGLQLRFMAIAAAPMVLLAATLVGVFHGQMYEKLHANMSSRTDAAAPHLAADLAPLVVAKDRAGLQRMLEERLAVQPDHFYAVVRSPSGEVLAQVLPPQLSGALPPAVDGAPTALATRELTVADLPVRDLAYPVGDGKGPALAMLQLGFSDVPTRTLVSEATSVTMRWGLLVFTIGLFAVLLFTRSVTGPLVRLSETVVTVARGDLAQRFETDRTDEVALVARSVDAMVGQLRGVLSDVRSAAQEIDRESQLMIRTVSQQSALTSQQASAISETSTTVREIAQTSAQATERADGVVKVAQAAEEISREGQATIERAIEGMQKLDEQVRAIALTITDLTERAVQIGDINQTVKDLAERSNMLALNASIEASKAGEQGKGFSVVAMEMRTLAEQSKQAAGKVRDQLAEVQRVTRAAVNATEEGSKRAQAAVGLTQAAAQTIVRLAQVCQESSLAGRQIAGNTRQQTLGVDQIVSALRELSSASQTSVGGTQEIERAAGSLKTLAGKLGDSVGRYRA